jgi:hypothetical protein
MADLSDTRRSGKTDEFAKLTLSAIFARSIAPYVWINWLFATLLRENFLFELLTVFLSFL